MPFPWIPWVRLPLLEFRKLRLPCFDYIAICVWDAQRLPGWSSRIVSWWPFASWKAPQAGSISTVAKGNNWWSRDPWWKTRVNMTMPYPETGLAYGSRIASGNTSWSKSPQICESASLSMCLPAFQILVLFLREQTHTKVGRNQNLGFRFTRHPCPWVSSLVPMLRTMELRSFGVDFSCRIDWGLFASRRLSYRQTLRHDLSWPQLKRCVFFFVRLRLFKKLHNWGWVKQSKVLTFLHLFTGGKSPLKGSHLGANLRFCDPVPNVSARLRAHQFLGTSIRTRR